MLWETTAVAWIIQTKQFHKGLLTTMSKRVLGDIENNLITHEQ